jgi:hypothetical protein
MADLPVSEQIRVLRNQGHSEAEAIRLAHDIESDVPDESEEALPDVQATEDSQGRRFVVVTKDFSGLGWAKKLQEEGEDVVVAVDYSTEDDAKLRKQMKQVGQGWVEVVELSTAVNTMQSDNTYWVFAQNWGVDEAKKLIAAGQHVFPPSIELGEKMEHDREYACGVAADCGLESPPTEEFGSLDEGLSFLDANTDKAYVFKPDDGSFNYMTFVPVRIKAEDANRELYLYLQHMKEDPGTFILQERIDQEDALEVNCELMFFQGVPFLASVGLELKRKNTYDLGEMCGCAGDFMQIIPLDSPLVKATIGKMIPFYEEQEYTGLADVNVIFTKDGVPHFLEVCNRFGYNSHPNLLMNLLKGGFGQFIVDFVNGDVANMSEHFHSDIGGSLTIFLDHPRPGLPVHLDPKHDAQFYPFDGYKEDDSDLLLTGYSDEIGIYVARGLSLEAVADTIYDEITQKEAVNVPDGYYRTDLAKTDYDNAPVLRYKELKKRKLI